VLLPLYGAFGCAVNRNNGEYRQMGGNEISMDVRTYFNRHRPGKPDITIRCINAIMRSGIETMDDLCEKDEEQLMRIRNFGQKCLEHTITLREKYALEKNNNQKGEQIK
jgi:DNA-directed RNA polymerase alpha subunit